jgi:hypothetical protein
MRLVWGAAVHQADALYCGTSPAMLVVDHSECLQAHNCEWVGMSAAACSGLQHAADTTLQRPNYKPNPRRLLVYIELLYSLQVPQAVHTSHAALAQEAGERG